LPQHKVILFFRKPRESENFSIEGSFGMMREAFPSESDFQLDQYTLSYMSNGIIPRLRAIIEAGRHQGDINHVTGDVHYLVFGLRKDRTVLTIHDCGFINNPSKIRRKFLKWLWLDLPARRCEYVTAVSEATRRDIIRLSHCDPEKVVVIPTIISSFYTAAPRKFNAGCPRILHIGLAPNKNFERHVEAISGINCHLQIVGKLKSKHFEILEKNGIDFSYAYDISQADMLSAYVESDIVLFASTFEGFGMPIIEGQSVGRAVVTSNISSMPEVAGNGACLVDPYRVDSIRNGVLRIINDMQYRTTLVDAGFENIKRFSPETVALQYEDLYRKISEQSF